MHRKWLIRVLLVVSISALSFGQTQVHLKTQSRRVDFSTAASTIPARTGTSLPATCQVGEMYYKTDAPPGQNLYGCVATDAWSVQTEGDNAEPRAVVSGNSVTIGANCAPTQCRVRMGSKVFFSNTVSTISQLAGPGAAGPFPVYLYLRPDGVRYLGVDGVNIAGATVLNLQVETGISNFPAEAYPLAICSVSNNLPISCEDMRAAGRDILNAGDNTIRVVANPSTGEQSVTVNPSAVVLPGGDNDLNGNNKINLGTGYLSVTLANNAAAGTMMNRLAMLAGDGTATVATAAPEAKVLGVCVSGCGNTGVARIATRGVALVEFDGATTTGGHAAPSASGAGKAADAGPVRPIQGQVLGYALSTNAGAGTYPVILEPGVVAGGAGRGAFAEAPACDASRKGFVYYSTDSALQGHCDGSVYQWFHGSIPVRIPASGDTNWFNQTSATLAAGNGSLMITGTASPGVNLQGRIQAVPGSPYTQIGCFALYLPAANNARAGLFWADGADPGTNKIVTVRLGYSGGRLQAGHDKYTNATTWGASYSGTADYWVGQNPVCLALSDDGATRKAAISTDARNWKVLNSEAHDDYLTPVHVGFFVDSFQSNQAAGIQLISWETRNSAL